MLIALLALATPAAAGPWVPATTCPDSLSGLDQQREQVRDTCKADGQRLGTCLEERGWKKVAKPEAEIWWQKCTDDRAAAMAAAVAYLEPFSER